MSSSRRYISLGMVLIAAAVWLPHLSWADEPSTRKTIAQQSREGTLVASVEGRFELSGDRVSFHAQDSQPIRCLENLALHRIVKQLAGIGRDRRWLVHGTLTEFQGRNYLLVTRAVLKNRAAP